MSGLKRREVSERSQLPLERREEAGGGAGGTTGAGAGSSARGTSTGRASAMGRDPLRSIVGAAVCIAETETLTACRV
jgi:hypothetical protein